MSKVIQLPTGKNIKPKNKHIKQEEGHQLDPRVDLLQYVALMVQYWNGIEDNKLGTHERLVGLVMSILQALDGRGFELPQYEILVKEGTEKTNISGNLEMLFPVIYEVVAAQVAEMKDDQDD
jgi:hypothetical protein